MSGIDLLNSPNYKERITLTAKPRTHIPMVPEDIRSREFDSECPLPSNFEARIREQEPIGVYFQPDNHQTQRPRSDTSEVFFLKSKIEEQRREIDRLKSVIAQKDQTISNLTDAARNSMLNDNYLKQADVHIEGLMIENKKLKQDIREREISLNDAQFQKDYEGDLLILKGTIASLERERDALRESLERFKQDFVMIQHSRDRRETNLDSYFSKFEQLLKKKVTKRSPSTPGEKITETKFKHIPVEEVQGATARLLSEIDNLVSETTAMRREYVSNSSQKKLTKLFSFATEPEQGDSSIYERKEESRTANVEYSKERESIAIPEFEETIVLNDSDRRAVMYNIDNYFERLDKFLEKGASSLPEIEGDYKLELAHKRRERHQHNELDIFMKESLQIKNILKKTLTENMQLNQKLNNSEKARELRNRRKILQEQIKDIDESARYLVHQYEQLNHLDLQVSLHQLLSNIEQEISQQPHNRELRRAKYSVQGMREDLQSLEIELNSLGKEGYSH